jgi:hypothetical protein
MAQTAKNRKLVHSSFGHVRLRASYSDKPTKWKVKLFGGATKLEKLII